MNVTATIDMPIPNTMLALSGSPNISVPTRIAVIGSNTPSTEALVAPMLREAMARVAVETIVGSSASPKRHSHAVLPSMPAVIVVCDRAILPRNTIDPTIRV